MKTVAPHTLLFVAARDRHYLCHAGKVVVKSRVETRHLGQVRKPVMERLSQLDLLRQVLGVERL